MRLIQYFILAIFSVIFFTGCEKVIDVRIKDADPLLVIEGSVSNRTDTQFVNISMTAPLNDTAGFQKVSGAVVTVTDEDGIIYNFRERAPGIYSSRRLRGIPGRRYDLKVMYEGKEFTSQSTMPNQVSIDSIGFINTNLFSSNRTSVQLTFKDTPGFRNYYRFLLSVNGVKANSIFVYNDDFTDGNQVKRELFDTDVNLNRGDVVKVQMLCTDQSNYKYWLGLDQNRNRGGASITPANPVSNISNGALGYFSAHTEQQETLSVPF